MSRALAQRPASAIVAQAASDWRRTERVVDLLEPEVLAAVNDYVSNERPRDSGAVYLFLVGGNGPRRAEPLSYQALRRMFTRRCESLGIREPWMTPHTLRHTHATRMWGRSARAHATEGVGACVTRVDPSLHAGI